jgi:hypothetical protein
LEYPAMFLLDADIIHKKLDLDNPLLHKMIVHLNLYYGTEISELCHFFFLPASPNEISEFVHVSMLSKESRNLAEFIDTGHVAFRNENDEKLN